LIMSIYTELKDAGIETDNHESDLYCLKTEEAKAIIKKHEHSFTTFISQIDGKQWLDIPFAFDPFWKSKRFRHRL